MQQDERSQLAVQMLGEDIRFVMKLKQKRNKEPVTRDELKMGYYENQQHKTGLAFTGKMVFKIEEYLPGNRTEWLETGAETMEQMLPNITAAFITIAPQLVERTRLRKEEEDRRRITEAKRYQEERQAKLATNRLKIFNELAKRWKTSSLAREFLEALKATEFEGTQLSGEMSNSEWFAWLETEIETRDPLQKGPDAVFETLAKVTEWDFRG